MDELRKKLKLDVSYLDPLDAICFLKLYRKSPKRTSLFEIDEVIDEIEEGDLETAIKVIHILVESRKNNAL